MFLDPSYDPTTVPINPEDVEWAAQCAVGLDKLIANNNLSAMAYYYEGLNNYYERVASNLIVGNTLLVSKGIPLAGEADMKTCMRTGPMTMLGLSSDVNGHFHFVGAEAESQRGPIPQMGNTWTRAHVNSNINKFVVDWAKAGNTHHLSLCMGHQTGVIEKLAKTLPYVSFRKVD